MHGRVWLLSLPRPSCPLSPPPQEYTDPVSDNATEWKPPHATALTPLPCIVVTKSGCARAAGGEALGHLQLLNQNGARVLFLVSKA